MISRAEEIFINIASIEAEKSSLLMRHGCVVVKNGKIVGRGYNNPRSTSRDNFIQNSCSCHAEMAALRQFYHRSLTNTYGKYSESIKGAN
jgi:tRNA(Arg) A34 adenosine deaminase TadA